MKRARYLAHCCEQALSRGEPLHAALASALSAVGGPKARERAALGETMGGQIEAPLLQLGFEPVAARAAQLAPERAEEVGRRLRALPDSAALSAHALQPLRYVRAVLIMEVVVATMQQLFVLPTFLKMAKDSGSVAPVMTRASAILLEPLAHGWVFVIVPLLAVSGWLAKRPARRLLWEATAARVCAAASALTGGGMEGSRSVGALADVMPEVRARLEEFLRDGGLAAEALRQDAEALIARAHLRADRLRRIIWDAGMSVALLFALLILASAYGFVSTMAFAPFQSLP